MGERADETDARGYVATSSRDLVGDLRLLQQVADGDYDGGSVEMLESLGLDVDDEGCVDMDEAIDALYEYPLAVETTTVFEILLGVGGPDCRLCLECDRWPGAEGSRTTYDVRRVGYRYSWSGSAEVELVGDDREVAEAFAHRVVPQLAD